METHSGRSGSSGRKKPSSISRPRKYNNFEHHPVFEFGIITHRAGTMRVSRLSTLPMYVCLCRFHEFPDRRLCSDIDIFQRSFGNHPG
jgi:hypothetical protein